MGADLRVTSSLVIPEAELTWRSTRSGGPGGQHANTSDTRVEVVFDVESSRVLGPRQRARILERLGPTVRASAADTRSQARNREIARARLADRIGAALRTPARRRATRPTRAAERRRREAKKRRSDIKRSRRRPAIED
ncbi:MAG: alternative ribosome rescue aminoacyl-tRNA hydrolase ArfB [Acidimicrobiia bacterium]|nr:alternative ribosome rescue aminoacyl-tRNA hydrolase ArfB [Acidimicrobiia bacterium]